MSNPSLNFTPFQSYYSYYSYLYNIHIVNLNLILIAQTFEKYENLLTTDRIIQYPHNLKKFKFKKNF